MRAALIGTTAKFATAFAWLDGKLKTYRVLEAAFLILWLAFGLAWLTSSK